MEEAQHCINHMMDFQADSVFHKLVICRMQRSKSSAMVSSSISAVCPITMESPKTILLSISKSVWGDRSFLEQIKNLPEMFPSQQVELSPTYHQTHIDNYNWKSSEAGKQCDLAIANFVLVCVIFIALLFRCDFPWLLFTLGEWFALGTGEDHGFQICWWRPGILIIHIAALHLKDKFDGALLLESYKTFKTQKEKK